MIKNISYKNREVTKEINNYVGKPFPLIKILMMRGIGSERLLVEKASENLFGYFGKNVSSNFCNIELRPGGIIIRFKYILDSMAWIIPYHHLSIFKSASSYTIHAHGDFLSVKPGFKGNNSEKFIQKVLKYKNEYMGDHGNPA